MGSTVLASLTIKFLHSRVATAGVVITIPTTLLPYASKSKVRGCIPYTSLYAVTPCWATKGENRTLLRRRQLILLLYTMGAAGTSGSWRSHNEDIWPAGPCCSEKVARPFFWPALTPTRCPSRLPRTIFSKLVSKDNLLEAWPLLRGGFEPPVFVSSGPYRNP